MAERIEREKKERKLSQATNERTNERKSILWQLIVQMISAEQIDFQNPI